MTKLRIAVIGAGPAGLTAAYQLSKKGQTVDLFEASEQVGGLSKSIDLWGQRVDLGPHRFFSNDNRVNSIWLEVAGADYRMVDRLTRIYYKQKFFYYPLKPFDALYKLGFGTGFICLLSYLKEQIIPVKQDGTFETWVIRRFGRRLYSIFFKTYSEKLWGISCRDLDKDFAAQRIKKLSLFGAIWNSLLNSKRNKHKTLIEQFAYPLEGTGMIYERMADFIKDNGGNVYCSTPVQQVNKTGNIADSITFTSGLTKKYDRIISTMPITLLIKNMEGVPKEVRSAANQLTFRNTILVYLKVEGVDIFPDNWLYIHSEELRMGRVTNFSNWVPEINRGKKSTILAIEYWAYDEDDIWKYDDNELIDLAKSEIQFTNLIGNREFSEGHVIRIPKCYPVYKRGYRDKLKKVENYLTSIQNLSVIGRYGSFKYNNQDHSILMGLLVADNIVNGTQHSLWEINTDYEVYQEKSVITSTGLKQEE